MQYMRKYAKVLMKESSCEVLFCLESGSKMESDMVTINSRKHSEIPIMASQRTPPRNKGLIRPY